MKVFLWILVLSPQLLASDLSQWRGPNRDGVFPETGLLKSWPDGGPRLLWSREGMGDGYSSVCATDQKIFVTGRQGVTEYLIVLDRKGEILWKAPFGKGVRRSYPGSRCTPTVEKNRIYLISGQGEVVCLDEEKQKTVWKIPALEKFKGKYWQWEIAESPLLVDDKVIYTPGGDHTTMVALDKQTGKTVWKSESIHDLTAFVSPILIKHKGKKIIVNVLYDHIVGVNAQDGKVLWKVKYSEIEPTTDHPWKPHNNCITPIYHDGFLFVTSGYDHVGVMFKLIEEGDKIKRVWINRTLDCHHGQVVRINNLIFGANWVDNRNGNWCCVDWATGKTLYEKKWRNKGSVSAADNMLYCYEEKTGHLALVAPTNEEFKIISSFQIKKGKGPHWAQPVIKNGVLFIRHGDVLMAYDVKDRG